MPERAAAAADAIKVGEIHLWGLVLSDDQHAMETWLDQGEIQRLRNIFNPVQARRYLVSRCALRQILGNYLGTAPRELSFAIEPGGKPYIATPDSALQFNLTHTGDIGMLAVSSGMAVGIDIERIRPLKTRHAIARRVFTAEESKMLEQLPDKERDNYFFRIWTSLEARQKCAGNGIFGARIKRQSVGLHPFQPLPGYWAAVAWENPSLQPRLMFYNLPVSR